MQLKCGRETWDDVIQGNIRSWNLLKENSVDSVIWKIDKKSAAKAPNPWFKERRG